MPRLQAICLDLDDTLLDDETSFALSVANVSRELVTAYPQFDFSALLQVYRRVSQAYWLEVAEAVMSGRMDGDAVRLEGWRRALAECGCDDASIARDALDAFTRHRLATYSLFEGVLETMEWLADRYALAIITNGSTFTQKAKIESTRLDALVQTIAISGEVGVAKPDAAIFHHVLAQLEVEPEAALHVGDSLAADVQGARNAGLRAAVWLNRHAEQRAPGNPMPDYTIEALPALRALLARIEG